MLPIGLVSMTLRTTLGNGSNYTTRKMTLTFLARFPINVCSIEFKRLEIQFCKFFESEKETQIIVSRHRKPEYVLTLLRNHSMHFCVSWRETDIHSFEKHILHSSLRFFKRLLVT